MKSFVIFCVLCLAPVVGFAANPMFANANHQIGLYAGIATGGSSINNLIPGVEWDFQPFSVAVLQYSQPMELFRLPGRYSIHFGGALGFREHDGEDWHSYSNIMAGLSADVALVHTDRFYFGTGLGAFEKSRVDVRQDSRFMFQLKLFAGYRVSSMWSIELFTQHFSNGNLTPINKAYNFAGLALLMNF